MDGKCPLIPVKIAAGIFLGILIFWKEVLTKRKPFWILQLREGIMNFLFLPVFYSSGEGKFPIFLFNHLICCDPSCALCDTKVLFHSSLHCFGIYKKSNSVEGFLFHPCHRPRRIRAVEA